MPAGSGLQICSILKYRLVDRIYTHIILVVLFLGVLGNTCPAQDQSVRSRY